MGSGDVLTENLMRSGKFPKVKTVDNHTQHKRG